MTILFVLLTFLVIMAITYYTRREQPAVRPHVLVAPPVQPRMARELGFEIPKGYCFHPGHTWVLDEGRQNARVGMDTFAANLMGKIDRVEVAGLNRWIRQGQKVWSVTSGETIVDMLSPVEGVVIAVNPEVQKDPGMIAKDPYKEGWVCVIKSPDLAMNTNNLLRGQFVAPFMQDSVRRVGAMTAHATGAAAADGGVPVPGVITRVEPNLQKAMIKEFFLT